MHAGPTHIIQDILISGSLTRLRQQRLCFQMRSSAQVRGLGHIHHFGGCHPTHNILSHTAPQAPRLQNCPDGGTVSIKSGEMRPCTQPTVRA